MKKHITIFPVFLIVLLQQCSTLISNVENQPQIKSWLSEIDSVCIDNNYPRNNLFVEQYNAIDCQRFFDKYEQYGSSSDNPINPCFGLATHELINEVLLYSASGETEQELKKYLLLPGSTDTLFSNLHSIRNQWNKNRNIVINQTFTGLSHYKYCKKFVNYLHCNGYQLDTVSSWEDTRKRAEINITADITFQFDTNKIEYKIDSGTFGTSEWDSKKMNMVAVSGLLPVYQNDNYMVVKLNNSDNNLELLLVLPKSASGLKIINDSIPNIINLSLESQNVTFKIPICTFNNSAPLNSKYEHYGVKTAFSDTFANFKNVNDSGYLYVEAPSNSSNISLDKFGVTMNQTERFQFNANRNEPLVLREWVYGWEDYSDFSFMDEFISLPIDCYPFIFILRDKLSNRILFLGKIIKP